MNEWQIEIARLQKQYGYDNAITEECDEAGMVVDADQIESDLAALRAAGVPKHQAAFGRLINGRYWICTSSAVKRVLTA